MEEKFTEKLSKTPKGQEIILLLFVFDMYVIFASETKKTSQ